MMRSPAILTSLLTLVIGSSTATADRPAVPAATTAKPPVGKIAPDFQLTDTDGKTVKLSALRGKVVVLEWFNPDCPFVKQAHGEGALEDMAARWTAKGVVWLAVNSAAPAKQGYGRDRNAAARKEWSLAHPVLLDETGVAGKAYGATNTPHMYVIDKKGTLVYAGGLDNAPFGEVKGGGAVVPYAEQAIEATLAGKKVPLAETRAYGCGVKYGS